MGVRLTHSKNKPGCWKKSEGSRERRVEKYLHVDKLLSGFDRVPHRVEEEWGRWGKFGWWGEERNKVGSGWVGSTTAS